MRLHTTRQTPLTGDVKTVAALNAIQIAPFQMMDRWCSDMLDPGFTTVAILRQEMAVSLDCVLSYAGQGILRHAAARPSNSGYAALGDGGVA